MAMFRALSGNGGGSTPKWLPMDLSNTNHTISANWGYAAEQVVMAFKLSGNVWFLLIDMSTPNNIIYGVTVGTALSGHTFSEHSITANAGADGKSFSITHNLSQHTFSSGYIIPLTNSATFS